MIKQDNPTLNLKTACDLESRVFGPPKATKVSKIMAQHLQKAGLGFRAFLGCTCFWSPGILLALLAMQSSQLQLLQYSRARFFEGSSTSWAFFFSARSFEVATLTRRSAVAIAAVVIGRWRAARGGQWGNHAAEFSQNPRSQSSRLWSLRRNCRHGFCFADQQRWPQVQWGSSLN